MTTLNILVPVYNGERYIFECLNSILKQMTNNCRLIILDDGSKDSTSMIVDDLIGKYKSLNIVFEKIKNKGLANARNHLLSKVDDGYVFFIDADDVLLDGAIDRVHYLIRDNDVDIFLTDVIRWNYINNSKKRRARILPDNEVLDMNSSICKMFLADNLNYTWATFSKIGLWRKLPEPYFEIGLNYEDLALMPRLIRSAKSLIYIPEAFLNYRDNPTSIVNTFSLSNLQSMLTASARFNHHLKNENLPYDIKLQADAMHTRRFASAFKSSFRLIGDAGDKLRKELLDLYFQGLFLPVEEVLAKMKKPTQGDLVLTHRTPASAYVKAAVQAQKIVDNDYIFTAITKLKVRFRAWRSRRRIALS